MALGRSRAQSVVDPSLNVLGYLYPGIEGSGIQPPTTVQASQALLKVASPSS